MATAPLVGQFAGRGHAFSTYGWGRFERRARERGVCLRENLVHLLPQESHSRPGGGGVFPLPSCHALCDAYLAGLDPRPRVATDRRKRKPLARRLVTLPPQDFNSNPVRIEDEECVVVLDVAIFLGREVNVRVACEASRVRGVDLVPLVDLERQVLDSHGVVAVLTFVGRS